MNGDLIFQNIARVHASQSKAPSSLKARLYTRLIHEQQQQGPLADVASTKRAGGQLCVFEDLVQIAPVGTTLKSPFYCDVCHARLLAEHMDNPPIWWPGCPYAQFKQS